MATSLASRATFLGNFSIVDSKSNKNRINYFSEALSRWGISPRDFYENLKQEWESAKLNDFPIRPTIYNWINGKHKWALTPDQWEVVAKTLDISVSELKILLSGREGNKQRPIELIDKVMARTASKPPIEYESWTFADLRRATGLTQTQFGKVIGFSLRGVQGWELGERLPNMSPASSYALRDNIGTLLELAGLKRKSMPNKA